MAYYCVLKYYFCILYTKLIFYYTGVGFASSSGLSPGSLGSGSGSGSGVSQHSVYPKLQQGTKSALMKQPASHAPSQSSSRTSVCMESQTGLQVRQQPSRGPAVVVVVVASDGSAVVVVVGLSVVVVVVFNGFSVVVVVVGATVVVVVGVAVVVVVQGWSGQFLHIISRQ